MSEKEIHTFDDTVKALDLLIVSLDLFFHFSIMYIFLSGQKKILHKRVIKSLWNIGSSVLLSTVSYFSS